MTEIFFDDDNDGFKDNYDGNDGDFDENSSVFGCRCLDALQMQFLGPDPLFRARCKHRIRSSIDPVGDDDGD